MTWTTPRTYTAGEVVTAAILNTDHRDNISYLFNVAHGTNFGRVPAAAWPTTSTTFTDWNGATPLSSSFTKRGGTETQLRVDLHTTGFVTGGAGVVAQFAYRVGSTDYTNSFPHYFNATSDHRHMSETMFIGPLAAGTYTIKLRVAISAQTFNVDGNDFAELAVQEVAV